jgi:hypothetical protein
MFTYHSQRGIQLETLWSNAELLLAWPTRLHVTTAHAYGAFELASSLTNPLRLLATVAQLVGLAGLYAVFAWRGRRDAAPTQRASALLLASMAAVVIFIIAGKVFSPQYLIWLIPLVVLVPGAAGLRLIKVCLLALALTQVLFPYAYHLLVIRSPWGVAALTVRNAALLVFVWQLARLVVRDAQAPRPDLAAAPVAPAEARG